MNIDPSAPIVFEGSVLSLRRTGVAQYAANLATGLARLGVPVAAVLSSQDQPGSYLDDLNDEGVDIRRPTHRLVETAYWALDRLWTPPAYERLAGPAGLVLFPNNRSFPTRVPQIATIHDLVQAAHPECIEPDWARRVEQRIKRIIDHADVILADTQTAAAEIMSVYGVEASRIAVVPCAPAPRAVARPGDHGVPGAIIAVGTIEPRKNLINLIRAHRLLDPSQRQVHPLLLIGGLGYRSDEVQAEIQGEDHISLRSDVDQAELSALFGTAAMLVQPSIYEGFGMPPVEALATDLPLVCSNIPVLKEVTQGLADAYVDPLDVTDIARGISEVLAVSRADVATRRANHQSPYSWEHSALLLKRVIDRLVR